MSLLAGVSSTEAKFHAIIHHAYPYTHVYLVSPIPAMVVSKMPTSLDLEFDIHHLINSSGAGEIPEHIPVRPVRQPCKTT